MDTTLEMSLTEEHFSLDSLAKMSCAELEIIYREGKMPTSMAALNGQPQGRMLSIRGVELTPLALPIRYIASAKHFPWSGKSFEASHKQHGKGVNRLNLVVYNGEAFPFNTVHDKSAIDGKPCIYLDYDLKGNPWFIRKIRDELREVSLGLFLGPAMWKQRDNKASLVLWFAIDIRSK